MFYLFKKINPNRLVVIGAALLILDIFVFWQIFFTDRTVNDLKMIFFEVGQGDSQLVILPGGVKILIDGGPANNRLLTALSQIFPPFDRYLDLIILSHPQLDHFGGLIEVLKRYRIGAFIYTGQQGESSAWADLKKALNQNRIKTIILTQGDEIRYLNSYLDVLWPPADLTQRNVNDLALVLRLVSASTTALFTGDISSKTEKELIKFYSQTIDVLKVAHHGSKYSSSIDFLKVLKPRLALIGVGKNSYGHPAFETLSRLASVGAAIFRTDIDGTITLKSDGKKIQVFKNQFDNNY